MIFNGDFFHGGQLRWNLGWPSPNYAGAFLATTLPFVWTAYTLSRRLISSSVVIPVLLLLIEASLYYVLCKTYSRGALFAAVTALLTYFTFELLRSLKETGNAPNRASYSSVGHWAHLTASIIILVLCVCVTGFYERVAQTSLSQDASVGNRWEFWRACTEMMTNAPWHGWGAGESGRAYMNWFQRVDRREGFITPVNSFLQIGVEYGIPVFVFALFASILPLAGGIILQRKATSQNGRSIYLGAWVTLLAWNITNSFSSLWEDLHLWCVPSAALVILLFGLAAEHREYRFVRLAVFSMTCAMAITLGLCLIGSQLGKERKIRPTLTERGTMLLTLNKKVAQEVRVLARLDEEVLGFAPGKEIRRWLANTKTIASVEIIPDQISPNIADRKFDYLLLFGRQAVRITQFNGAAKVLVIHPIGSVPQHGGVTSLPISLILPEIDQRGDCFRWGQWGRLHNANIRQSSGCGNDIRVLWPSIMPSW